MGANAVTSVPTYVAGQVLDAARLNVTNSGVPVFADTTARDAGFGGAGEKTLAEGQLCYLESTNVVQYYDGAAWATVGPTTAGVIQVKSTTKTDAFSMASATFADVTGVTQSITPTSASNLVLVTVTGIYGISDANNGIRINLVRNSTNIAQATGGATNQTFFAGVSGSAFYAEAFVITFLDSPATTSATTYKIQVARNAGAGTVYVGRGANSADHTGITTITCMEVAP